MQALRLWRFWGIPISALFLAGCVGSSTRDIYADPPEALKRDLDSIAAEEEVPVEPPLSGRYIVKRGDTLSSIKRRFGISLKGIFDANPELRGNSLIRSGQVLQIPGPAAPKRQPLAAVTPSKTLPRAERRFIWPARGRVLVRFGQKRPDAEGIRNRGVNIRVKADQEILAAKSGRVTVAESVPGFGRVVILEHSDDTTTFYGHNSEILVASGTTVRQGDAIALGGSSGRASMPSSALCAGLP